MRRRLDFKVLTVAASALLATLVARANDPAAPMPPREPVDHAPTAFACSLETLLSEKRCFLEGQPRNVLPPEEQARENLRLMTELSTQGCLRVSRPPREDDPDPVLLKLCRTDARRVAEHDCLLAGQRAVVTEDGLFTAESNDCYDQLQAVLRKTRLMATWSAVCCRCLAQSCSLDAAQCNAELVKHDPGGATLQCVDGGQCDSECEDVVPAAEQRPPPPPPPPPAPKKKKASWY